MNFSEKAPDCFKQSGSSFCRRAGNSCVLLVFHFLSGHLEENHPYLAKSKQGVHG
jgi:hypothetical protein